jgi:hypothetical protein
MVLEVVSFLLVTIDLYGADRVEKLKESINLISDFFAEKINKFNGTLITSGLLMTFARVFAFFDNNELYSLLVIQLKNKFLFEHVPDHDAMIIISTSLYGIVIVLLLSFLYLFFLSIYYISERFSGKGIMIATGTILFIISKIIIY